jgi:medium-chain acyl-[acyl-carrier-protein] hydrolase
MGNTGNSKGSVSIRSPRPAAWLRLFCFPYAGGGASVYSQWSQNLPVNIEVAAVQLPGREWRIQEPLLESMSGLVDDALESMRSYLDKPFALLGTSMGGTLIFELARRLRAEGLPQPVCLVPCACGAPHIPEPVLLHKMSDAELLAEISDYGVMSDQVRDHPELAEMFLPLIRNDCMVHETYAYTDAPPLVCPIWVYGGLYDETISRERLESWSQHTEAETQVHMVDGGHLFVDSVPDMFLASLSRRLLGSLEKAG